ncbi:peptide ABC transporter substrate-binding protein, partial [Sulfobacillus acidophilus]|nr:peptide ABC transporter substrate-binding protein [Sulfobacillus acidophilus]
HIIEPIYKRTPSKLKKHRFGQEPILAGAYTIDKWEPGQYIRAKKNPYAKGILQPTLDEIVWRIIPQTNTLESNLVAGTIDAISPIGLSLDQATQFEKRHSKDFDFHYTPGLVWEHIDFNLDNEILKEKKVRQALAFGANRKGIVKLLFNNKQPVAHGTEPPKSPYHNPYIKKYPYDPKKANELLEQTGWVRKEKDGIRYKNEKELKLVLMSTSGNKTRERVEQLLQSQWRKIGVNVEIKNQPAKVFFGDTLRKRKYSHMAMYSWVKDPVAVSDTLWRCDYIPSKSNNYMGQNQPGWCNKKADKLLKSASRELDDKKRAQIGKDFESLWATELPALPLYFRVEVSITKKGLKNWSPTGMLQPVSWNAHKWAWN